MGGHRQGHAKSSRGFSKRNHHPFTPMKFLTAFSAVALCALVSVALADDEKGEATTAFGKLKQLDGTWTGAVGKPDGDAAKVIYKVTAGGSVVMETLFPGTDHEMISM